MALMVERYTGLIWSVVRQHLADPEDIKECVNDTFIEFYCHQERFDGKKGSLKAFLAGIAKNQAVSRYRRNRTREALELPGEVESGTDEIGKLEEGLDLEKALEELKPEDAKILRMKYYDGMTVWEIAESLGLPYETVKKRHQRSLGKLRLNLIASISLLLLAMLAFAACTYAVLQHFWVILGYGVRADSKDSIYILEEQAAARKEGVEFVLQDALLAEGQLWIYGTSYSYGKEGGNAPEEEKIEKVYLYYGENVYSSYRCYTRLDPESDWVSLSFEGIPMPSGKEEGLEMKLVYGGMEINLRMKPAKEEKLEDYSYAFGERGGLLAIPYLEEGELVVGLYPLSIGNITVLPTVLRGIYMEGKSGEITAASSDGGILTGEMLYRSPFSDSFTEWNFGAALPGEYVLHVPYVFLSIPVEPFSIPINLETCRWEEQEYKLSVGSLSVASCEKLDLPAGEVFAENSARAEEGWSYWLISLDCKMDAGLVPSMLPVEHNPQKFGYEIYEKTGISLLEAKDNNLRYLVRVQEEGFDLTQYTLNLSDAISVKWMHPFDITITAGPEE